jgi:hypothetical protein
MWDAAVWGSNLILVIGPFVVLKGLRLSKSVHGGAIGLKDSYGARRIPRRIPEV